MSLVLSLTPSQSTEHTNSQADMCIDYILMGIFPSNCGYLVVSLFNFC